MPPPPGFFSSFYRIFHSQLFLCCSDKILWPKQLKGESDDFVSELKIMVLGGGEATAKLETTGNHCQQVENKGYCSAHVLLTVQHPRLGYHVTHHGQVFQL